MSEIDRKLEEFKTYRVQRGDLVLSFEYPSHWQAEIIDDHFVPNPPYIHVGFRAPTFYGITKIGVSALQLNELERGDDHVDSVIAGTLASIKEAEKFGLRELIEDVKRILPCGEGIQITYTESIGSPMCRRFEVPEEVLEKVPSPPRRGFVSIIVIPVRRYVCQLVYFATEEDHVHCRPIFEHMLATFQILTSE